MMKSLVKIVGAIIVLLLLVFLGIYIYFSSTGIPKYEPIAIEVKIDYSEEALNKGEKLSSMVCKHCHMNPETGKLTGRRVEDIDPAFGTVYSSNITQHKENGIGSWTDEDLVRLLKTGIKKNGDYAPPYMPKFPNLSDGDINAIINFLRSDNVLVQADATIAPKSEPSMLTIILCNLAFKPFEYTSISEPDTSDPVLNGKYLATAAYGCFQCHSADFKTNNDLEPEKSEGYFGGGNLLYDMEGNKVLSPNITMDKETGIGNWTEMEFVNAVRYGRRSGQKPLQYPMLPYSAASEKEIKDIYAYLQTVKSIENKVEAKD
jgi:cytochrome c2